MKHVRSFFLVIVVLISTCFSVFPEFYTFNLSYHPDKSLLKGTVIISFFREEIADSAHLLLFNNRLSVKDPDMNSLKEDVIYKHGFQPAYTKITSIRDETGAEVPFINSFDPTRNTAVILDLAERESYILTVAFETVIPEMLSNDITSLNNIWLQRFLWYPKLLIPHEKFSIKPVMYSLKISLPGEFMLITGYRDLYDESTWHMESERKAEMGIPICIIPEKEYNEIVLYSRNYDIAIYAKPKKASRAYKIARFAVDALDYHAEKYGRLDLKRITIFESPVQSFSTCAGSGLIILGGACFNSDKLDPYVDYILSNEIAYMYFGKDNYLSESLTRYISIQYIEKKYGYEHSIYRQGSGIILGKPEQYANLREKIYSEFIQYAEKDQSEDAPALYSKGALAMRQIATEVGIDVLNRAICSYYEHYKDTIRYTASGNENFLEVLEEYHPGITGRAEAILYSDLYPDFYFQKIIHDKSTTTLYIQEKNHTGYSSVMHIKTDKTVEVFNIKDGDVITVGGRVLSASIDPEWYTLDINRKNNYFPRKFNFFISKNSKYEADSLGPAFGIAGEPEQSDGVIELDFMTGIQYKSEGVNSFYIEGGSLINTVLPYQPLAMPELSFSGVFGGIAYKSPREIMIGAAYLYYIDGRWQAELVLKREEKFIKEALYYPQIYYSLGFGLNEQKEISSSLDFIFAGFPFMHPFLVPLSVNTLFDPFTSNVQGTISLSLFPYLRLLPRVYLSPSIDGAIGFGTEEVLEVPGRARALKAYSGKHRFSAGMDLLFPIASDLDIKILNLFIFRSILSSVYIEIEQLHSISDPGIQSMHMGLEIGFKFSTIGSTISGDTLPPIAIGLDIPIYDITRVEAYSVFLYTSLPLKYYGMILGQ